MVLDDTSELNSTTSIASSNQKPNSLAEENGFLSPSFPVPEMLTSSFVFRLFVRGCQRSTLDVFMIELHCSAIILLTKDVCILPLGAY
jgi:hypothetical protein